MLIVILIGTINWDVNWDANYLRKQHKLLNWDATWDTNLDANWDAKDPFKIAPTFNLGR